MTAEDTTIRARVAETLRAWYSRQEHCNDVACDGCREAGQDAADALADAGLLPTAEARDLLQENDSGRNT